MRLYNCDSRRRARFIYKPARPGGGSAGKLNARGLVSLITLCIITSVEYRTIIEREAAARFSHVRYIIIVPRSRGDEK